MRSGDAAGLIPKGRLRDILRQAARLNLIRLTHAESFEETGIEVLPAIRRVLPFRELAAWQEMAANFRPDGLDEVEDELSDEDDLT